MVVTLVRFLSGTIAEFVVITNVFSTIFVCVFLFNYSIPDVDTDISKTRLQSEVYLTRPRVDLDIVIEQWLPPFISWRCSVILMAVDKSALLGFLFPVTAGCTKPWETGTDDGKCLIIVPAFWSEAIIEHELRHCEGFGHDRHDDLTFLGIT